jgi:hypothetical protein
MYRPDEPIPASDVPCNPAVAVPASNALFAAYDDRAHALRAQDVSRSCLRGVEPPGLPVWPPEHILEYPKSSRMIDNEIGESDNTAETAFARRELHQAGPVQPSVIAFGTAPGGSLTLTSLPTPNPPTSAQALLDAKLAAGRVLAFDEPTASDAGLWDAGLRLRDTGLPRGQPMRPEASGAAVAAAPPAILQQNEPMQEKRPKKKKADKKKTAMTESATRQMRMHLDNLSTAVPGLAYDLSHIQDIRATNDSRYSTLEFVFGRGGRGLYLAIILSLAAVIAAAARCIER